MNSFSVEFWVVFQLIIDMMLVVLILLLLRSLKANLRNDLSREAVEHVIGIMEPLLKDASDTVAGFEQQLKEKNLLIKSLNDSLDSRIISLNLLLNRSKAEFMQSHNINMDPTQDLRLDVPQNVYDQQKEILNLSHQGLAAEQIAQRLGMPKGEVDLVIDLKKKFV